MKHNIEPGSMLDRAAFALFVKRGLTHAFGSAEESWERSRNVIVGQECIADALVVIEALREPTDSMVRAAHDDSPYHAWRAMIDAALDESKNDAEKPEQ